jgi:hypothetical protein
MDERPPDVPRSLLTALAAPRGPSRWPLPSRQNAGWKTAGATMPLEGPSQLAPAEDRHAPRGHLTNGGAGTFT